MLSNEQQAQVELWVLREIAFYERVTKECTIANFEKDRSIHILKMLRRLQDAWGEILGGTFNADDYNRDGQ